MPEYSLTIAPEPYTRTVTAPVVGDRICPVRNGRRSGRIRSVGWHRALIRNVRYSVSGARLSGEGLFTDEEIGTTCCFATQDKVWVSGPAGEKWEVYTVLADSDTFGATASCC